jgi:hypothetical protein
MKTQPQSDARKVNKLLPRPSSPDLKKLTYVDPDRKDEVAKKTLFKEFPMNPLIVKRLKEALKHEELELSTNFSRIGGCEIPPVSFETSI